MSGRTATVAFVKRETLSDGSVAYNVQWDINGVTYTAGCISEGHAVTLADCLNDTAWIQESK